MIKIINPNNQQSTFLQTHVDNDEMTTWYFKIPRHLKKSYSPTWEIEYGRICISIKHSLFWSLYDMLCSKDYDCYLMCKEMIKNYNDESIVNDKFP